MDINDIRQKSKEIEGTKYGHAGENITIQKTASGYNDDGSIDCSGTAYVVNNADSDSKVELPIGSAADQKKAFENAGQAGEYVETNNATQIEAGDYIFTSDSKGGISHVMPVINIEEGKVVVLNASYSKQKAEIRSFSTGSNNWLSKNLDGIGKVNRAIRTPDILILLPASISYINPIRATF